MKNSIILTIFLLFLPPALCAEDDMETSPEASSYIGQNDHIFNLKLNAAGLLINLGDLTLEYKVSDKLSLSGSFLIGKFNTKSGSLDFDINTVGGNLRGNWFYNGVFTNGFYSSLYGGHLDFDVKLKNANTNADLKFSTPYIGAMIGYGWFWEKLNFTLGAGYNHAFEDDEAEITVDGIVGKTTVRVHTKFALEASFGWLF